MCQCIDEVNSWMCQNFLQLNKDKTEVIAFGNKDEVLKVKAYLSFSSHVKAITKSAYYHLKNIARIRCFVSNQDLGWILPGFWAGPQNMNISHQSSGLYTGSQLHLGLVLKYYYWYIYHLMGKDLNILQICCSLNEGCQ